MTLGKPCCFSSGKWPHRVRFLQGEGKKSDAGDENTSVRAAKPAYECVHVDLMVAYHVLSSYGVLCV